MEAFNIACRVGAAGLCHNFVAALCLWLLLREQTTGQAVIAFRCGRPDGRSEGVESRGVVPDDGEGGR